MTAEVGPLCLTLELARAKDAGDPYAFQFEAQTYLVRSEDGSFESAIFPWTAETLADLAAMQLPRPDPALRQRFGELLRSFLTAAGWRLQERIISKALAAGRQVRITVRSAAAEMYALPWELVTLGNTGQYLGAIDQCLVRYEWPGTETARPDTAALQEGGRIVFAWSAAGGSVPATAHLTALRTACKDEVPFDKSRDVVANVSLPRLQEVLAAGEPPRVLHILCHGGRLTSNTEAYGLVWNGTEGSPVVVDPGALAQALAPHARTLRLVVIAACHGAGAGTPGNHLGSVAQALHRVGIPAVIASRFPLSLDGSVLLTETLYRHLLQTPLSLEDAFVEAREQVEKAREDMEWASLQLYARAQATGDQRPFVIRPYRGLRPFTPRDRRFYFGRDDEARRMLDVLRGGERLLTVVGASGSGKSSLVMAGIVPAILEGALGEGAFQVRIMRPGPRPCEALSAVLASVSTTDDTGAWRQTTVSDADSSVVIALREKSETLATVLKDRLGSSKKKTRLLLVVDQLEEMVSIAQTREEAQAFASNLVYALNTQDTPLVVIVTVRADFLGAVLDSHRGLAADVETSIRVALPMSRETLREVIVRPAAKVGLRIDPGVTDALLDALDEAPRSRGADAPQGSASQGSSNLPLLEFALEGLWERRVGDEIPWAAWQSLGGLRGALAKKADEVLAGCTGEAQKALVRGIFERLVQLGDGVADTRRYATRAELESVGEGAAAELDRWIGARLLSTDGADIAVAHEALIREWETLRQWIAEDRETLTLRQEVRHAARRWVDGGKLDDDLLRGARLRRAAELLGNTRLRLSADETAFLESAVKAQEAEALAIEERRQKELEREQQGRRRARLAAFGAVATALAMGGFGIFAKTQEMAATDARAQLGVQSASSRQLALIAGAREIMTRHQASFAMRLLLEVEHPEERADWADTALDALEVPIPYYHALGHTDAVTEAVFSPDGSRFASASDDWTARIWSSVGRGAPVILSGHTAPVLDVDWSPDGAYLATSSGDKTARIWRSDGSGEPVVLVAHEGPVLHVAFSPDGKRVATASADNNVRIWRADGVGRSVLLAGHEDEVRWVTWTSDGKHVISASRDRTARVWDVDGKEPPVVLRGHDAGLLYVELDRDEKRVLTSGEDGTARIYPLDAPTEPIVLRGHRGPVYTASFSPDGNRVATSSVDMTARIWDSKTGEPTNLLQGHALYLRSAFWSPDGKWILTAAWDTTARLWSADGKGLPIVLAGHLDYVQSARFSPDGKQVVTASNDGIVRVWNVTMNDPRFVNLPQADVVWSVAFSPDGEHVVTAIGDNTAQITRTDGSGPSVVLRGHTGYLHFAAFSPDGKQVITAAWDKTVRLWDLTGKPTGVVLREHEGAVNAAFFSPDGKHIATACEDRLVRVFPADGKAEPLSLRGHEGKVLWVAYSPDGKRIASASSDHTARIWNADGSGSALVLKGHERAVTSVAWSLDGQHLVTTSEDLTAKLWSADGKGEPVTLTGHDDSVTSAAFSPDGQRVVTASEDRTLRIWSTDGKGQPVVLRGHPGIVRSVAWSPNGNLIASGSEDRSARIWNLARATEMASRDVTTLKARMESSNVDCLPRFLRRLVLDESPEQATERGDACERGYGRPPVPRASTPFLD